MGPKTRGVPFWFLPFTFLSCFSIYLLTLNPAFQPDDSAETIASCVTLMSQHPSGYPLHSLLGHVFSLLPIGNPAFRLNLLAAVLGSLLVSFVAFYLWDMVRSFQRGKGKALATLFPAYIGAMVLAFS